LASEREVPRRDFAAIERDSGFAPERSAKPKTESKISRTAPRESAERSGAARLEANRSALIRAFCALRRPSTRPQRPPVHNFFRGAKAAASGAIVAAKLAANGARACLQSGASKNIDAAKTYIPSAFLRIVEIFTIKRAPAKIFGLVLR
jgi:hypothetical protein